MVEKISEDFKKEKAQESDCEESSVKEKNLGKMNKNCEAEEDSNESKAKIELEKLNDRFLRLAAEYDNYRKRSEREKIMIYSEATVCTLLPLLPIFDTIDRAFETLKNCDDDQKKGFEMVHNQIMEIFKKMEITVIGKVGEKFNPNLHNAVSHSVDEKFDENTVSMVLQKGYSYNGKLIRPAMVQVVN